MPPLSEADTCRKYVVPKLQAAHQKLLCSQLRGGDVLINLVSPDAQKLLSDYLVRFRLSPVAQDEIHGGKVETARPNISLGDARDLEFPIPPLPEQRRIAAELDALQAEVDALKRLQTETIAELDALLPATLDRAFKGQL